MMHWNKIGKSCNTGRRRGFYRLGLATVLALMMASIPLPQAAEAAPNLEVNADKGGEPLEVASLAVQGKTTLIEFYSPYCPPCLALAPLLEQLSEKRTDLAIKKVNINRKDIRGIDWHSPLAKQYSIRSVPHFMIFKTDGKMAADGKDATEKVIQWLKEAGL